jgi:hypothetical protein
VLEGLNARPIGELSPSHEISQAQCYQWREQFPAIQEEIAIGMATSRFHRAGPTRHRRRAPAAPDLGVLHGPGAVCVSRGDGTAITWPGATARAIGPPSGRCRAARPLPPTKFAAGLGQTGIVATLAGHSVGDLSHCGDGPACTLAQS